MNEISNSELMQKLESIINKNSEEIKQEIKGISNQLNGKLEQLEKRCIRLENRVISLERKSRKNNIIIFGLDISQDDLLNSTVKKLNDLLEIEITASDVNNIYVTRNKNNIIIEFISFLKKLCVIKNTKKLKGTGIFIDHDLSPEDRLKNKILYHNLKAAQNKNYKAYIKNHKLYINGKSYTPEELEPLEDSSKNVEDFSLQLQEKANSAPPTPTPSQRESEFDEVFVNEAIVIPQIEKPTKLACFQTQKAELTSRAYKKTSTLAINNTVSISTPKSETLGQKEKKDVRTLRSKIVPVKSIG